MVKLADKKIAKYLLDVYTLEFPYCDFTVTSRVMSGVAFHRLWLERGPINRLETTMFYGRRDITMVDEQWMPRGRSQPEFYCLANMFKRFGNSFGYAFDVKMSSSYCKCDEYSKNPIWIKSLTVELLRM